MHNFFPRSIALLTVLLCLVAGAGATEVILDNGTLMVKGVDDSIGLGAISVVVSYGGNLSVQSVKGESGFMIASNIQNGDGQTFIAGISTEGHTGDVPVATISTNGVGDIEIFVRELANVKGDPIPYTNEEFEGAIPTPVNGGDENVVIPDRTTAPSEATSMPTTTVTEPAVITETNGVPAKTPVQTTVPDNQANPTASETTSKTSAPTQAPLSIFPIGIAIGSILILTRR